MNVDFLSRNQRLFPYIKLHMFGTLNRVKDISIFQSETRVPCQLAYRFAFGP